MRGHYRFLQCLALVVLVSLGGVGLGSAPPTAGTRVVVVPPSGSSCRVSVLGPGGALETVEVNREREFLFPASAQLGVLVEVVGGAAQAELRIHMVPENAALGKGSDVSAKGVRLVGAVYGDEVRAFTIGAEKAKPARAT